MNFCGPLSECYVIEQNYLPISSSCRQLRYMSTPGRILQSVQHYFDVEHYMQQHFVMVCVSLCAEPSRKAWRSGSPAWLVLLASAICFALSTVSASHWWSGPGENGVNVSAGLVHTTCLVLVSSLCPLQLLSSLRSTTWGLKAHRTMAEVAVVAAILGAILSLIALLLGVQTANSAAVRSVTSGAELPAQAAGCLGADELHTPWASLLPFRLGYAFVCSRPAPALCAPSLGAAAYTILWLACAAMGRSANSAISTTQAYSIQQHIARAHQMAVLAVLLSAVHFGLAIVGHL